MGDIRMEAFTLSDVTHLIIRKEGIYFYTVTQIKCHYLLAVEIAGSA